MSAQTSRYQLTYPTGSDLVSGAPAQLKTMAETIETALGQVDDRQTDEAVKPVVRPTLTQLSEASGVTGQTGYVTADDATGGVYVYTGSAWNRPAAPVTLWEGTGPKTGTLTLSLPPSAFSFIAIDTTYAYSMGSKTFMISGDTTSSICLSYVAFNISTGQASVGEAICKISDSSLIINAQRYSDIGGSTVDRQAVTITRIRGII